MKRWDLWFGFTTLHMCAYDLRIWQDINRYHAILLDHRVLCPPSFCSSWVLFNQQPGQLRELTWKCCRAQKLLRPRLSLDLGLQNIAPCRLRARLHAIHMPKWTLWLLTKPLTADSFLSLLSWMLVLIACLMNLYLYIYIYVCVCGGGIFMFLSLYIWVRLLTG